MSEGLLFNSASTVEYNGVTIDNIVSSKVTIEPTYNERRTTVKFITYTIDIEAIVHPDSFLNDGSSNPPDEPDDGSGSDNTPDDGTGGNPNTDPDDEPVNGDDREYTDDALALIRRKLMEPRKVLKYKDKGLGTDVVINPADNTHVLQVADYGPKPLRLTFEPFAGRKAARVNWSIKAVLTRECEFSTANELIEFWATSTIKINKSGYQTLTRKGRFEVFGASSEGTLGLQASASAHEIIGSLTDPNNMEGYHLEHDIDFSPNDKVCTFTLTYTEIESPNAYPLGVTNISCSHSAGSSLLASDPLEGAAYRSWKNTMSCSISLRPNVPQLRAWEIFSAIASDRLNQSVSIDVQNINGVNTIVRARVPIVLSMEIKEEMFNHAMTFSIVWISYTQTIADIFNRTGLFKPFVNPNETWNNWVVDIRNGTQNTVGNYALSNIGSTSDIIDKCDAQQPTVATPDTNRGQNLVQIPAIFNPACPPEEASWLDYQNKCEIESSSNQVTHRRYKSSTNITRDPDQIEPRTSSTSVSRQFDTNSTGSDHFTQDFGNDKHVGVVRGYAVRIGRPTEPPRVEQIGGRDVVLDQGKSKISNVVLSANDLCAVHVTQWDLRYDILGHPTGNIETEISSSGGPEQFQ